MHPTYTVDTFQIRLMIYGSGVVAIIIPEPYTEGRSRSTMNIHNC